MYAQIREQEVVLRVQQLVRLRKAEGMRRFEVLLRHMVDGEEQSPERVMQTAATHGLASMIDRRVIGELISWLHRNAEVLNKQLHDGRFDMTVRVDETKRDIVVSRFDAVPHVA